MALIGSGTSAIQNHYTAGVFSAAALDRSLRAIAEQIGGVAWTDGAAVRLAGNLTAVNFASGLAMPNNVKRERNSIVPVALYRGLDGGVVGEPVGDTPVHIGSWVAPRNATLTMVSVFLDDSDSDAVVGIYKNGASLASVALPAAVTASGRVTLGVACSGGDIVTASLDSYSASSNGPEILVTLFLSMEHE